MANYNFPEFDIEIKNPVVSVGSYLKVKEDNFYTIKAKLTVGAPQNNTAVFSKSFSGFIPSGDILISALETEMLAWVNTQLVAFETN
jgi:hypothetical protein